MDAAALRVQLDGASVVAASGGEVLCRYRFGAGLWKPYLHPLRLPGGPNLLADAPADHPHHHGLWFGHGRLAVAGRTHDLWLERPGCGRIEHAGLRLAPDGWEAEAVWRAADGGEVARDRRVFRLRLGPGALTLEVEYALEGEGGILRGTNEAGLPLLRPAPWIAARGGGAARSDGGASGEAELHGRAARWVDYSGEHAGRRWGIACVDHPANYGGGSRWFLRDYGPFGPNDGFFRAEPTPLPLRLRYTVVAHEGAWPLQGAGARGRTDGP